MTIIAKDRDEMDKIDKFKNHIRFRRKIEHVEQFHLKKLVIKRSII